jgi:hypothetical protein
VNGADQVRVTMNDTADVAAAIGPTLDQFVKQAAPAVQRVADDIYERLLYSVQDYLKENAEWNVGGEIERCRKIEADNRELRTAQSDALAVMMQARVFMDHTGMCASIAGRECTCGYPAALASLDAAIERGVG